MNKQTNQIRFSAVYCIIQQFTDKDVQSVQGCYSSGLISAVLCFRALDLKCILYSLGFAVSLSVSSFVIPL